MRLDLALDVSDLDRQVACWATSREVDARFAELEASLTRQVHSSFRTSLGAHATTLLAVLAVLATR